jgi:hypothetical protein
MMNLVRDMSIPLSHYNAEGRKRLHYSFPLNISADKKALTQLWTFVTLTEQNVKISPYR